MRLFGAHGGMACPLSPVPSDHTRIGSLEEHNWPTEFVRGLAFIAESDADKVESKQCPNGGTGRRARFRTWFSQGSGGSSPLSGTNFYPLAPDSTFSACNAPSGVSSCLK